MNLNKFDAIIIVGTVSAIIFLNFFAVHTGIGSDEINESEIPELNLSANFIILDMPQAPGSVSSENGTTRTHNVTVTEDAPTAGLDNEWLSNPLELKATQFFDANQSIQFKLIDNGNNEESGTYILTESNEVKVTELTYYNVTLHGTNRKYHTHSGSTSHYHDIFAEVVQFGDTSGGFFSGLIHLAAVVGWGIASVIAGIINIGFVMADILAFGFGIITFIVGNYGTILGNAGGFATILVAIPPIVLFIETMKVGLVVIDSSSRL